jgi:hypothetical protein
MPAFPLLQDWRDALDSDMFLAPDSEGLGSISEEKGLALSRTI